MLINFVPYVSGLIVLVFMCLPGTKGRNRFGPDPVETNLTEVFSRRSGGGASGRRDPRPS